MTDLRQLHNQSTEQIVADIEGLRGERDENAVEISRRLVALRGRGVKHPLMNDPLFRYYEWMAAEKIHPGLVAMWGGQKKKLALVVGRDMEVQKRLLANVPIRVAVEKDGEVVEAEKPPQRLDVKTLARVFPEGKPVATVAEQRAALQAEIETRPAPPPNVRADTATRRVYIGKRTSASLEEVQSALAAVGLTVIPATPEGEELLSGSPSTENAKIN